jgi:hypothetical protein
MVVVVETGDRSWMSFQEILSLSLSPLVNKKKMLSHSKTRLNVVSRSFL